MTRLIDAANSEGFASIACAASDRSNARSSSLNTRSRRPTVIRPSRRRPPSAGPNATDARLNPSDDDSPKALPVSAARRPFPLARAGSWRRLFSRYPILRSSPSPAAAKSEPRPAAELTRAFTHPAGRRPAPGDLRAPARYEPAVSSQNRQHCARFSLRHGRIVGRLPQAATTLSASRVDSSPLGAIAQLGERLDRTQEVGGSSPPSSINEAPANAGVFASMEAETAGRFRQEIAFFHPVSCLNPCQPGAKKGRERRP